MAAGERLLEPVYIVNTPNLAILYVKACSVVSPSYVCGRTGSRSVLAIVRLSHT